jgi:hypothetical protein
MLRQARETQIHMKLYGDQKGQNFAAQPKKNSFTRGRHDFSQVAKLPWKHELRLGPVKQGLP